MLLNPPDAKSLLPPALVKSFHYLLLPRLSISLLSREPDLYQLFGAAFQPDVIKFKDQVRPYDLTRSAYIGYRSFDRRTEALQHSINISYGGNHWWLEAELIEAGIVNVDWRWLNVPKPLRPELWTEEVNLRRSLSVGLRKRVQPPPARVASISDEEFTARRKELLAMKLAEEYRASQSADTSVKANELKLIYVLQGIRVAHLPHGGTGIFPEKRPLPGDAIPTSTIDPLCYLEVTGANEAVRRATKYFAIIQAEKNNGFILAFPKKRRYQVDKALNVSSSITSTMIQQLPRGTIWRWKHAKEAVESHYPKGQGIATEAVASRIEMVEGMSDVVAGKKRAAEEEVKQSHKTPRLGETLSASSRQASPVPPRQPSPVPSRFDVRTPLMRLGSRSPLIPITIPTTGCSTPAVPSMIFIPPTPAAAALPADNAADRPILQPLAFVPSPVVSRANTPIRTTPPIRDIPPAVSRMVAASPNSIVTAVVEPVGMEEDENVIVDDAMEDGPLPDGWEQTTDANVESLRFGVPYYYHIDGRVIWEDPRKIGKDDLTTEVDEEEEMIAMEEDVDAVTKVSVEEAGKLRVSPVARSRWSPSFSSATDSAARFDRSAQPYDLNPQSNPAASLSIPGQAASTSTGFSKYAHDPALGSFYEYRVPTLAARTNPDVGIKGASLQSQPQPQPQSQPQPFSARIGSTPSGSVAGSPAPSSYSSNRNDYHQRPSDPDKTLVERMIPASNTNNDSRQKQSVQQQPQRQQQSQNYNSTTNNSGNNDRTRQRSNHNERNLEDRLKAGPGRPEILDRFDRPNSLMRNGPDRNGGSSNSSSRRASGESDPSDYDRRSQQQQQQQHQPLFAKQSNGGNQGGNGSSSGSNLNQNQGKNNKVPTGPGQHNSNSTPKKGRAGKGGPTSDGGNLAQRLARCN